MNTANRSLSWLRDRRAYCVATLADPRTAEHRKARIIAALDQLDAELSSRCTWCGRPLSLPESVRRAAGAVCVGKHGVVA